jgi:ferredoxin-nitrite reductase
MKNSQSSSLIQLEEAFNARNKKQNKIEKIKELKTPRSVYKKLDELCSKSFEELQDEDKIFFLKCFGLYGKKDGTLMLRLRIPAGQLNIQQAIKIGEISQKYAQDYIDITTRQQLELRYLKLHDIVTVIKELDSIGITTFQTGIDNFRNIVTSSFNGLGDKHIIDCAPIIKDLQSIFMKKDEWIATLPRKFNTAVLGTNTNDCNIYGHDCSFIVASKNNEIGFNLYLGGKVGVQAKDTGLFIKKDQVISVFKAVTDLFKTYGFRDNRNKNRLHFLLEAVGMDTFVKAIIETSGIQFETSGEILAKKEYILDESGIFHLSEDLKAVHFSVPSGIFKGSDLIKVAQLCNSVDGQIRLSVEQSLYIIVNSKNSKIVKQSELFNKYKAYNNIYFNHQIACAGEATCDFGVIPNKPDAIEMANYLSHNVPLKDGKIKMYWSGCVKGCGAHGIADIGFEGCKTKDTEGNSCYGVHIYLGGKATKEAKEARILYKSLPLSLAKQKVKNLVQLYKDTKLENETFESFDTRVLSALTKEQIIDMIEV